MRANGAFERSRAAAQAKLDGIVEEARTRQGSARLVEKLYEIKTGEAIKSVKLAALAEEWEKIARRRQAECPLRRAVQIHAYPFCGFVREENPKAVEMAHVTRSVAAGVPGRGGETRGHGQNLE